MRGKADSQLESWGEAYLKCMTGNVGSSNLLFRIMVQGIPGDSRAEHRILTYDMPPWVLRTHRAVLIQCSADQLVLKARYCAPLKDDGTRYEHRELATLMGMSRDAFKSRLRRARSKVSRVLGLS